jgi:CheY-like chemotaxis protein
VEASARRQEIKAAVAVGAALAKSGASSIDSADAEAAGEQLADVLPGSERRSARSDSLVLWVDDRPQNNVHERRALEALRANVVTVTSTDEAIETLAGQRQHFDLIISDMRRPPDDRAGYTLLDTLRRRGDRTPYVIYTSSRAPEHMREAISHGALGATNSPQELIQLVLRGLRTDEPKTRQAVRSPS